MKLTIRSRGKFVYAIRKNLNNDPNNGFLRYLLDETLEGLDCYLAGGRPRDAILENIYGRKSDGKRDYDLWIDDSEVSINLVELFEGEEDVTFNRFGNPKWRPAPNVEFDVNLLSGCNFNRHGVTEEISIKTALVGNDLTTGSIAYGLRDRKLYDFMALEALGNREIDINYTLADEVHILMTRLVLHAERFGFKIGPKGYSFVKKEYSPKLDIPIVHYLDYKGYPDKSLMAISKLRSIARPKVL